MGNSHLLPNPNLEAETARAIQALREGHIIAYPTEGVFGLGCLWQDEKAVKALLALKQRPVEKGLILIAATWEQVAALVVAPPAPRLTEIQETWPGPVTWVFPASALVPTWIRGEHATIAIRVSAHPIVRALCLGVGQAIVSTSANRATEPPLRTWRAVSDIFGRQIACVIPQDAGDLSKPTPIFDAMTGQQLR